MLLRVFVLFALLISVKIPILGQNVAVDATDISLQKALIRYSELTGKSVLAEGTPMLRARSIHIEGTEEEVLEHIARAFDYEVGKSNGVYLLRKHFLEPTEYPQIPNLEMITALA